MSDTKIAWADKVWNPTRGCSRVSAGCDNCYAMRQARRFDHPGGPYEGLTRIGSRGVDWSGDLRLAPDHILMQPFRWRKPCRIFVNSMSDLFHEALPFRDVAEVFHIMTGECDYKAPPDHTYMILTKRPRRALEFFQWLRASGHEDAWLHALQTIYDPPFAPFPRIWIGVSIEDQETANARIPPLMQIPAAIRFVSYEPMLGPVDLRAIREGSWYDREGAEWYDAIEGHAYWSDPADAGLGGGSKLDWVIAGGESGPRFRMCMPEWFEEIAEQCSGRVPLFIKQDSHRKPGQRGRLPAALWYQFKQFPSARREPGDST